MKLEVDDCIKNLDHYKQKMKTPTTNGPTLTFLTADSLKLRLKRTSGSDDKKATSLFSILFFSVTSNKVRDKRRLQQVKCYITKLLPTKTGNQSDWRMINEIQFIELFKKRYLNLVQMKTRSSRMAKRQAFQKGCVSPSNYQEEK